MHSYFSVSILVPLSSLSVHFPCHKPPWPSFSGHRCWRCQGSYAGRWGLMLWLCVTPLTSLTPCCRHPLLMTGWPTMIGITRGRCRGPHLGIITPHYIFWFVFGGFVTGWWEVELNWFRCREFSACTCDDGRLRFVKVSLRYFCTTLCPSLV